MVLNEKKLLRFPDITAKSQPVNLLMRSVWWTMRTFEQNYASSSQRLTLESSLVWFRRPVSRAESNPSPRICTNSTSARWCTTSPLFLCQWHASCTQNMSSRRETSPVLIAAHFNKPVLHRWSKRAVFTWEAGPVMYSGAAFPRVANSSWAERASSGP